MNVERELVDHVRGKRCVAKRSLHEHLIDVVLVVDFVADPCDVGELGEDLVEVERVGPEVTQAQAVELERGIFDTLGRDIFEDECHDRTIFSLDVSCITSHQRADHLSKSEDVDVSFSVAFEGLEVSHHLVDQIGADGNACDRERGV